MYPKYDNNAIGNNMINVWARGKHEECCGWCGRFDLGMYEHIPEKPSRDILNSYMPPPFMCTVLLRLLFLLFMSYLLEFLYFYMMFKFKSCT